MTLYIIRGLPGSGKSTFAKAIGCLHLEADMYHVHDGKYQYDQMLGKHGHEWCKETCKYAMAQGMDVAVSNTFTQLKEFTDYLHLAECTGHDVHVIRMTGEFGNVHNVPLDVLDRMKSRFEDYPGETFR